MTGSSFGNYRVEEQIGKGGMGVVYRAIDSRLGRSVAIKVLPDGCAKDPGRRARFAREARLLAALNHEHIAAIHGLEEFGGICGLILEYVPGETLEKRIASGKTALQEALNICIQIADALEVAHANGIIHRDLKPANVKITPEGKVKILDFGLAKALEREPAPTETDASTALETRANAVLGTPGYMSPEQAQAKPLDRRADVWAFGCILYELLAGRRAFGGATPSDALAAVLLKQPDLNALPGDVPRRVRLLLRRCLEKDPRKRLRDIGDARLELEEALSGAEPDSEEAAKSRPRWPALVAGLAIGALAVGAWTWARSRTVPPPDVIRLSFDIPEKDRITPTWNRGIALSPDGRTVAFSHRANGLSTTFLRPLNALDARPLSNVSGVGTPAFSPDGRYLMVMDATRAELKRAPLSGGPPVTLTLFDYHIGGDWASDGYYYWSDGYFSPIVRIPGAGGKEQPVTELDGTKQERAHRHPQIVPGGKAIVFTVAAGGMESFNDARIDAYSFASRKRKTLVEGGFAPRYSPSGHLVYARAGGLYAVPFDRRSLEVTGPSAKVLDGVFMSTNTGSAYFDISPTGTLAFAVGNAEGGQRTLVWVDRQGRASPLPLSPRSYLYPRVSPDGKLVLFEVEGVNHDLYEYDPERGVTTKLTTDGVSHAPVWTPDGKRIAFRSWKAGTMTMWWMPADRSGAEERMTTVGERQSLVSFSPDGRYATFNQMDPGRGVGVWVLPLKPDRKPEPFVTSRFMNGSAKFSPDGKWVAYCTNESGKNEVFVQPWPGPGPKIQVSSDGGLDPIWNRDGRELYYRDGSRMMVVPVSLEGGFRAGKPRVLWEGQYSYGMSSSCGMPGTTSANYDVTRDGQRFLMVKDLDEKAGSTRIVVVVNFAEELKHLARTNN